MAKVGDKIKIINMMGEPQYTGKEGVIIHIDSIGQLHGTWGGCAVIPGEDTFRAIEEPQAELKEFQVEITETLQKTVTVKAASESDAIAKVKASYAAQDIILDDTCYIDTEYSIIKPE